jgi:peptide/nickel transport system permease protein
VTASAGTWRRLLRHGPGMAGLVLLLLIVLACWLGPVLSPYGASDQDLDAISQGPSMRHPFGTAQLGEDVMTRVLEAGRVSLLIGFGTALAATVVGGGLGLLAGGRGGWVDSLLARLADLFLIVPAFVVLIVLSLTFQQVGPGEVIFILALLSWPLLFRLSRASALTTRELPYVQAARAAGAGSFRVVGRHLLPAAAPEIASFAALAVGVAILAESALSFLSLGIDPDRQPSWGSLMIGAQDTIEDQAWLTLYPAGLVVLTVLAVSLVGDALRDVLDPAGQPARAPRRWAP